MKIALLVDGTRGDVQPMVALAHALGARGHEPQVCAPLNARDFVERAGVRYFPLSYDNQAFLESEEGRRMLTAGNVRGFLGELTAHRKALRAEFDRDVLAACEGADAIVTSVLTIDRAQSIAEARRIPVVCLQMSPMWPTGDFPSTVVTTRRLPLRALNRATHALFDLIWWSGVRDETNALRAALGLGATRTSTIRRCGAAGVPMIHAYSTALVPRPSDWGPAHSMVGYFHMPPALRARVGEAVPPAGLEAWLDAGPPPLYLGFGSMPVVDPGATLEMLAAVTDDLQQRAVVVAGWAARWTDMDPRHARLRLVGAVDHDWLLPRCHAAVHHGGAGTTAAVLAAGLPSVVASIFADQPFWAARVERMGAGVHVPFSRLDRARLTVALRKVVGTPAMRERAKGIAARIRDEGDGVPRAVALIERQLGAS